MKKQSLYLFIILIYVLSSCSMPTITRQATNTDPVNPQSIHYTSSSITMEWDYYTGIPVDSYNLYYRNYNGSNWVLLDTIAASSVQEFTIEHSQLGNGSWEFGITAIGLDEVESEIHSSLDHTANPTTGWYLIWNI